MDFGSLLHFAQKNEKSTTGSNYYRARFDPPKKVPKQNTNLSSNIQKFLAQKEEEEKRKLDEADEKRRQLLAMRDPKDKRKIEKMLKVIKSANKSVLSDTIDDQTAVTANGPSQPDEDDYGYESQVAADLYQKIMSKYSQMPVEEKFPSSGKGTVKDLSNTKDRVRAAIEKEREIQNDPHLRRMKRKEERASQIQPESSVSTTEHDDLPEKSHSSTGSMREEKKRRPPAPPPLDFHELLRIAEQKRLEPVTLQGNKESESTNASGDEPIPPRPMTSRERKAWIEEQERLKRRALRDMQDKKHGQKPPSSKAPPPNGSRPPQTPHNQSNTRKPFCIPKIPKKNDTQRQEEIKSTDNKTELPSRNSLEKVKSEQSGRHSAEKRYDRPEKSESPRQSTDRHKSDRASSSYEKHDRLMSSSVSSKHTAKISSPNEKQKLPEHHKYSSKPASEDKLKERNRESFKKDSSTSNYKLKDNEKDYKKVQSSDEKAKESYKDRQKDKYKDELKDRHKDDLKERYKNDLEKFKNDLKERYKNDLKERYKDDLKVNKKDTLKIQPREKNKERIMDTLKRDISSSSLFKQKQDIAPTKQYIKSEERNIPHSTKNGFSQNTKTISKTNNSHLFDKPNPPKPEIKPKLDRPTMATKSPQVTKTVQPVPRKLEPQNGGINRPVINKPLSGTRPNGPPRQFPPKDVVRQFPPSDVRQFPPNDTTKKIKKPVKRRIDSESEEDSELDDFIDDEDDGEDYSSYIKEIFGYDKSKYRQIDEDDSNMESNFAQVMREEYISKKFGIMEDLEDMRQEAEEKKLKALKKKVKKK